MVEIIMQYGLFLAETITFVIAFVVILAAIAGFSSKNKSNEQGYIETKNLNTEYDAMKESIQHEVLTKQQLKANAKQYKTDDKAKTKLANDDSVTRRKRSFVLNFDGDIKASAVESLRREISAVLSIAEPQDEVILVLESSGGMVHAYGLAASQLDRIKKRDISLTVCVDKVAASGGYMMAVLADKILAAPFAVLGSIGVVAQLPNFHRLLQKNDIDVELLTAGEYKRTLTMLGENTDKGREKFVEELEDTHTLFKDFVSERRPQLDIAAVATGEVWYGAQAVGNQLIDDLITSDEYIMTACDSADVYQVTYTQKKSVADKLGFSAQRAMDRVLLAWQNYSIKDRFSHK
ncbi:MAG: protease SohB [Pseudomonadales bacterium]|nr:protease SohB [Pseudomonadales bacterium]